MDYSSTIFSRILLFFLTLCIWQSSFADFHNTVIKSAVANTAQPALLPAAPTLNAKAYLLIDANSGKILADKSAQTRLPPASLTKMMTLYVISNALKAKQINLSDQVRISERAWRTPGSRMFVKEGQMVSIEDLIKGIIVDSGNDACVAMAEHLAGSEKSFSDLMNHHAELLGMHDSHFTDSTGLPDKDHYTTATDLAILARALIEDFPEYYEWYKLKWFTFNGIRQPNRNRLLWRDNQVDGLKTGHTTEAGFCLVASAKRANMRLISVILGAPNESTRADDSERLINYGFRFFETHQLYKALTPLTTLPVFKGNTNSVKIGLSKDKYVTILTGQYSRLNVNSSLPKELTAPITKGDKVGELVIKFDNEVLVAEPLIALEGSTKGGFFKRMKDSVSLSFKNWFS